MSLLQIKRLFQSNASLIKEYNLLNPTELGNGYCDAEEANNEPLRSAYWSALMLHYWYKIPRWQQNSISLHLPEDEFVEWLADSLSGAFYYRSWRYEYKANVKYGKFISWKLDKDGNKIPNEHYWKIDPNAVDKTINFFCSAQRGRVYQYLNKDKRKTNGAALSIESLVDDNGHQADYIGFKEHKEVDGAYELIELFLKDNKPLEALVLDGIAYQDSFKFEKQTNKRAENDSQGRLTQKRYVSESQTFNLRKLVKHLSTIDTNFIRNYFCSNYKLSKDEETRILDKLVDMNNSKWYKYIKSTLEQIKQDKKLLSCLIDVN